MLNPDVVAAVNAGDSLSDALQQAGMGNHFSPDGGWVGADGVETVIVDGKAGSSDGDTSTSGLGDVGPSSYLVQIAGHHQAAFSEVPYPFKGTPFEETPQDKAAREQLENDEQKYFQSHPDAGGAASNAQTNPELERVFTDGNGHYVVENVVGFQPGAVEERAGSGNLNSEISGFSA